MNTASKTRHVFILFLADIVWGIAFVAQSKGGDAVGAFSFNGIRFLIGALCLLPVIKILDKKELTVNRPESKKQKKELWIAGSCCGIALFFASNLQQLGISMGAESGKAGFLTATYILMVPILGIFLKRKCVRVRARPRLHRNRNGRARTAHGCDRRSRPPRPPRR